MFKNISKTSIYPFENRNNIYFLFKLYTTNLQRYVAAAVFAPVRESRQSCPCHQQPASKAGRLMKFHEVAPPAVRVTALYPAILPQNAHEQASCLVSEQQEASNEFRKSALSGKQSIVRERRPREVHMLLVNPTVPEKVYKSKSSRTVEL